MLNSATSFKKDVFEIRDGLMDSFHGIGFKDIDINLTLQKKFFQRRMAVNLRLGCGFTYAEGYGDYYRDDFFIHYNLGLGYMFLVMDNFAFELGIDYDHHNSEVQSGIIKPKFVMLWKI